MTANGGAIGTVATALRIDAPITAGSLVANAQTGINLIDVAGGLGVGEARSTTGDVTIATFDTAALGENINIGANGIIRAAAGMVTLDTADDIFLDAAATISAAAAVALLGDLINADPGVGSAMDLRGRIIGTSVSILTGDDGDAISSAR